MNGSQSTQISYLSEVVEELKEKLTDSLVAVVLFGSRARGDAHEESDWDVLIIAHNLPDRPFRRHTFLKAQLPPRWRAAISLIAKTPEEFEASLPAFYLDIALDGIVLYDPHRYMQEKLTRLQTLIRQKGLRRKKSRGVLLGSGINSQASAGLSNGTRRCDEAHRRTVPF